MASCDGSTQLDKFVRLGLRKRLVIRYILILINLLNILNIFERPSLLNFLYIVQLSLLNWLVYL
jgi:hypothetical protein